MSSSGVSSNSRLLSVDALRGFDMFWIIGGEKLFAALALIWPAFIWDKLALQMQHSEWHGFTAYDLIFPLFIFLSGVSLGLGSVSLTHQPWDVRKRYYQKLLKRCVLLIVLGIVYNHAWGVGIPTSLESVRYASVLGKIAIAWGGAALIVWHCTSRQQMIVFICGLIGYWLLQEFVVIGQFGGNYTAQYSLNTWVDQAWLPGIFYQNQPLDPEGLLANLPSILNALAGVILGQQVLKASTNPFKKIVLIFGSGCLLLVAGYSWGIFLPVNKVLWTSSFVLVSVGYSCILLAAFYGLIDALSFKRFGFFFAVIGINSIAIYLSTAVFDWNYLNQSLFGGLSHSLSVQYRMLMNTVTLLTIEWSILYALYKRGWLFKV